MNKRFATLFHYVEQHHAVQLLIAEETALNHNLADLAFCVEYTPNQAPGCGRISAYRLLDHEDTSIVHSGQELMANRIWFMENEAIGHDKLRFYALASVLFDYRPVLALDVNRPYMSVVVNDLPQTSGFNQVRIVEPTQPQPELFT